MHTFWRRRHSPTQAATRFVASSVTSFSSLSKRAGDTFVDNQKIFAKSKSIRAMMAVKKRKQNANEDSCAPVAFLENSGQTLETRPKSGNFR